MIDIICTQRIKPGMEEQAEKALREAEKQTLANDKGGVSCPLVMQAAATELID
jgi:hypothetical protein